MSKTATESSLPVDEQLAIAKIRAQIAAQDSSIANQTKERLQFLLNISACDSIIATAHQEKAKKEAELAALLTKLGL